VVAAAALVALGAVVLMDRLAAVFGEAPGDGPKTGMLLAMAAFWVSLNYTVHRGMDELEVGLAVRPWKARLSAVVASLGLMVALLVLVPGPHGMLVGHQLVFSWVAVVLLVGLTVILQVGLRTLADGLAFVLRALGSIRARLTALALLSVLFGGLGVWGLSGLVNRSEKGAWEATWVALVAGVVAAGPLLWGMVAVLARGLTRRLEEAARALERVGEGDLGVHLVEGARDEVGAIARAFNRMVAEVREKQFLERAFGCYLTDAVLGLLRRRGALKLAAERREATVLFADVRGFTALSEGLAPEEVLGVLNAYFEGVLPALQARDGYVDKLIGDAVMCIFGVPLGTDDHAARALEAAQEMQAIMTDLNTREAFGPGRRIEIGIGLHTGPLVAGSLGSQARAQYTVIGDTVNVASRLCGAAASGEVVLSAVTAALAGRPELGSREPLQVKNRAQPVEIVRIGRERG
jgi:class 3 adenylate cyclase